MLENRPHPLENTVTVHYNPDGGFTNDITDSATFSVDVVSPPSISVTKMASELSKVGDEVTYTFTVCNYGPVVRNCCLAIRSTTRCSATSVTSSRTPWRRRRARIRGGTDGSGH